jgi:glycosyltransferase involved in cell wall biosynthesis
MLPSDPEYRVPSPDAAAIPGANRNVYRVLVVTNLWPTSADPSYGSFVQAQMDSLRPLGVDYDVLFINGRESVVNYLRGVPQLRHRLKAKSYDLVHAHFGLSGLVARFQWQVPLVVSFMGDDVLGRFDRRGGVGLIGRLFQLSSFVLARSAAAVIVKSRAMKTQLRLGSAHVIPNGVDLQLFQPIAMAQARQRLGLDNGRKYVIFPYDPRIANKRYDLIENAVHQAQREVPELELLRVFGAPRSEMPFYLNAADALVLASHSEGSPNIVKEAMAVNLPVISVHVGDVAELIGSTEGCYLVPRHAEDIAAALVEVCRRGTRTEGRAHVARYAKHQVAGELVAVYASVTSRLIRTTSERM